MIAWIDLELTGLDVETDSIVEIASVVTADNLEIIEIGPDLIIHADQEALSNMSSVVVDMHTKSGLIHQIAASKMSLREAEALTLKFFQSHFNKHSTPLAGNSIGTDRRFLSRYMPELEHYLHYRSIDVSSVKELVKRWKPEILRDQPKKKEAHRAKDDIMESIEELRYYKKTIFGLE